MASISLVLLGFLAVVAGLLFFYHKTKKGAGSVIILVIGLVGLYIGVMLSDVVLSRMGLETGFPRPDTGYYLYQSFLYVFIGLSMLGTHYYLLKEMQGKEISYAFWWTGLVLLISGGMDLLIETFVRIPMMEFRLFLAIIVLGVLVFIANRYRDKFFGKKEDGIPPVEQPHEQKAPKVK